MALKIARSILIALLLMTSNALASLRVEMAQIAVRPGDFNSLLSQIVAQYQQAIQNGADLFVLPEGVLPGYPSNDVLNEREYIDRAEQAVEQLREFSRGKHTAMAIGHIGRNPRRNGKPIQNFVSVFENGRLIHRQAKVLLPTYGPFDDARYFEPGTIDQIRPLLFRGKRISFLICEDGWFHLPEADGRLLYRHNPVLKTRRNNPDFVISVSASPYNTGKQALRERVHLDVARRVGAPILYINQIGIVEGLTFDGGSFVGLPDGTVQYKMATFETDSITLDIPDTRGEAIREVGSRTHPVVQLNDHELTLKAMTYAVREYVRQVGARSVVVNMTNGLNSAMAAIFVSAALGPDKVFVIKAPPSLSNQASRSARESTIEIDLLLRALRIPEANILTGPIPEATQAIGKWRGYFEARPMRIQTANKSDLAIGTANFSADAPGFLATNADLFKSDLISLAEYLNSKYGREVIPSAMIARESGSSNLPSHRIVDPILRDIISGHLNQQQIDEKYRGVDTQVSAEFRPLTRYLSSLYFGSEYQRQILQTPTVRISGGAFGKESRKPMTILREQFVPSVEVLARRGGGARSCEEVFR